ncbi:hypothetical protein E2542_SST14109 [Spatholobus suberectus]|nr:hypothetical protein E2542_SST14109 [Spatholobus suberectus]
MRSFALPQLERRQSLHARVASSPFLCSGGIALLRCWELHLLGREVCPVRLPNLSEMDKTKAQPISNAHAKPKRHRKIPQSHFTNRRHT